MKNELTIINYVLQRLADVENENDVVNVVTELKTARKAISAVKCYDLDDMISALFSSVEVNADA